MTTTATTMAMGNHIGVTSARSTVLLLGGCSVTVVADSLTSAASSAHVLYRI